MGLPHMSQAEREGLMEGAHEVIQKLNQENKDLRTKLSKLKVMIKRLTGQPIIVTVEGGLVQWVEKPDDITLEVHDYDSEGIEPGPNVRTDKDGNEYFLSEW